MTTNAMVIDAVGTVEDGSSGPATNGIAVARHSTPPYRSQRPIACRLLMPSFGSRGGRFMISGPTGSSMIAMTGADADEEVEEQDHHRGHRHAVVEARDAGQQEEHHEADELAHLEPDVRG